jgi:hypothetical protein
VRAHVRQGDIFATLLDELARLDPQLRSELAATLRRVSDTFAEVSDGQAASHVLSVLAYLIDPN